MTTLIGTKMVWNDERKKSEPAKMTDDYGDFPGTATVKYGRDIALELALRCMAADWAAGKTLISTGKLRRFVLDGMRELGAMGIVDAKCTYTEYTKQEVSRKVK